MAEQSTQDRLELMDKIIKLSLQSKKDARAAICRVVCIAPDTETINKLNQALALIESAMQRTATYHADRRRKLIRGK